MTQSVVPYTGDYANYGGGPQWNWFDYLNQLQQPTLPNDPEITPPGQPSRGAGGNVTPIAGILGLLGRNNHDPSGTGHSPGIKDGSFSTGYSSATGDFGLGGTSGLGTLAGALGAPGGFLGALANAGWGAFRGTTPNGTLTAPGTGVGYTTNYGPAGVALAGLLGTIPGAGWVSDKAAKLSALGMAEALNKGGMGFGNTPGGSFTSDGHTISGMPTNEGNFMSGWEQNALSQHVQDAMREHARAREFGADPTAPHGTVERGDFEGRDRGRSGDGRQHDIGGRDGSHAGRAGFAEGGRIPHMKHGGWFKDLVSDVAPAVLGGAASYFTGSDILGGLTAGISSKLLGNPWAQAIGTGLGTGALSYLTGLSGAPGVGGLSGLFSGTGVQNALASGAPPVGGAESPGVFSGIGDWIKGHPMETGIGTLGVLGALGAGSSQPKTEDTSTTTTNEDPYFSNQLKKGGWRLDQEQTNPNSDFDWYQYGQMPQWQFFDNVNPPAVPLAKGGEVPALGGSEGFMPDSSGRNPALSTSGGVATGPGGGQDDKVPVYLSADEYVIPADVTAHLGDGSAKEGSKKLDATVAKIRKHKTSKGSKHPPMAKAPEAYING